MHANAQFEDGTLTWAARASLGELQAVLSPDGIARRNRFLHSVHLHAARRALQLVPANGVVLDFGCGTGRFLRYFGRRGCRMVGTEVTREMLEQARRFGLPPDCRLLVTDGVRVPLDDASVDMVWVSGVLRLCVHDAVSYLEIARELHRVLRPGRHVVNLEIGTELPPIAFNRGFERAGFATRDVRVLHRYGRWDRLFESSWIPLWGTAVGGRMYAALRYQLDVARPSTGGCSDYLFLWEKPARVEARPRAPISQPILGASQC